MKDRDRNRFQASITWFNQFFDGIRQIYEHIVNLLPEEFFNEGFNLNADNYYFPSYKAYPSIPAYYALMIGGRTVALQVVSIVDASLFSHNGSFSSEPSMIILVDTQPEKYAWLEEYALKVIKGVDVEIAKKERDSVWGKIMSRYPADFFAFQVQYDRFSDVKSPVDEVRKWIVDPILVNIEKGMEEPAPVHQPVTNL